jgi:hypothetical protein
MKLIYNGTFDEYINQFSDRLKKWLAGSDGIYGTNDDRRAYLRLGMKFDRDGYFHRKETCLFACLETALNLNCDSAFSIEDSMFGFEFENYLDSTPSISSGI